MRLTVTVLGFAVAAAAAGNGVSITKVMHNGDPVPGMPGMTFIAAPGGASLNDAGIVLFNGQISGPGVTSSTNNVLFTRVGGAINALAREADPVPGTPGYIFLPASVNHSGYYDLTVTPAGQIGFRPTIYNTTNATGVWDAIMTGPPASPALAIYGSGPAPGFPADTTQVLQTPASTIDGGLTGVIGRAVSTTNAYVIWTGNNAGMIPALQTGLQAPGLPVGVNLQSFGSSSLRMNAMGRIMFTATLATGVGGVNNDNRVVLYEGPPNQLSVLARQGNAVPGVASAIYTSFDASSIRTNAAGALCFKAFVSGGGTDHAIISHGGGQSFVLAKNGDPVPGHPGLTLGRLRNHRHDMNGLGRVAFGAQLVGAPAATDTAMFVGGPGGIEMVFREGDPLPNGLAIAHIENQPFLFNDREQFVLFMGAVSISRPNGDWVQVARPSTGFFTDQGYVGVSHPTVPWRYDANARAAGTGGPTIFNNEGQLLLSLVFTGSNGSGVFMFDVDDPCPADLVLPFGLLDLNDINAFVAGFVGSDPLADLDENGLIDLTDVNIFVSSFIAGCP
ncbi:MAG: hypothetical protein K8E66_12600 [Phycisphaerales bacterium]|nr:hypothetical protein [Phycisphaerales bacterium]